MNRLKITWVLFDFNQNEIQTPHMDKLQTLGII